MSVFEGTDNPNSPPLYAAAIKAPGGQYLLIYVLHAVLVYHYELFLHSNFTKLIGSTLFVKQPRLHRVWKKKVDRVSTIYRRILDPETARQIPLPNSLQDPRRIILSDMLIFAESVAYSEFNESCKTSIYSGGQMKAQCTTI